MNRRIVLALSGAALLALSLVADGLGAVPAVTIRIEGSRKTLLLPATVLPQSGFITKFGAPGGKCPANSAQGALDKATHGRWTGTWNTQYNEYFVTSILGEKPVGQDFWEIFVNNKAAALGACDIKLVAGEQLLFADESGSVNPSSLSAPQRVTSGHQFNVRLVGYNARGKSKPLGGVGITGNGIGAVKTSRQGIATIVDTHTGALVLRTAPKGYVRTEAIVHVFA